MSSRATTHCDWSGSKFLLILCCFHPIPVSCCYCAADDVPKSEAGDERRRTDGRKGDKRPDAWRSEAAFPTTLVQLTAQQNIGADRDYSEDDYGCECLFLDRHGRFSSADPQRPYDFLGPRGKIRGVGS